MIRIWNTKTFENEFSQIRMSKYHKFYFLQAPSFLILFWTGCRGNRVKVKKVMAILAPKFHMERHLAPFFKNLSKIRSIFSKGLRNNSFKKTLWDLHQMPIHEISYSIRSNFGEQNTSLYIKSDVKNTYFSYVCLFRVIWWTTVHREKPMKYFKLKRHFSTKYIIFHQ